MSGRRRPVASAETPQAIPPRAPQWPSQGLNMSPRRGMSIPTPEEVARSKAAARKETDDLLAKRARETESRQRARMAWAQQRSVLRAKVDDLRSQTAAADGRVGQARAAGDLAAAATAESERIVLRRWADEAQRELDAWQPMQPA
jgi:hypothetical protein